nr:hypothetical protein [Tanacetum cinerariifolium]GFB10810.1 hypothetical protein [Tanacetum cinerariifolium]
IQQIWRSTLLEVKIQSDVLHTQSPSLLSVHVFVISEPTVPTPVHESPSTVANLEKDMSELITVNQSTESLAILKSQVPSVVDNYLGSKVGDPSSTKETPKGKAPSKGSKTGKSTLEKKPVEEPIAEVVMDDAGDDVAHDDNQQQDASKPKTTKTLNPDLFKQPPRPPTFVIYISSIMKTKAARYKIKGIEDMVPTLWSTIKHVYDKDAEKEIKHWGERCKLWYRSECQEMHGYGHLEKIVVKRSDQQLYKFKEGNFVDLHLKDIEDMLLLAV